jgi:hypothetical protein
VVEPPPRCLRQVGGEGWEEEIDMKVTDIFSLGRISGDSRWGDWDGIGTTDAGTAAMAGTAGFAGTAGAGEESAGEWWAVAFTSAKRG